MTIATRLLQSRAVEQLRFALNRHLALGDEGRRVLVVGSGQQALRGYLLEAIHARGFPVTLLCQAPPTWERAFVDAFVVADFSRPDQVVEAVREATRERPVRGCLTYVEVDVPLAARVSEALGLRLYGPEVAERVRDKHAMRARLREAGLTMPASVQIASGGLQAALARVGLPAVFKPVRGEGSIHVLKLEREHDLAEAARLMAESQRAQGWRYGGYLLEEYVDGVEYSVESIVAGGRILHAAMTDKYKGAEPYFEEISHTVPTSLAPEAVQETLAEVSRAIAALGLDNCAVHTELKRGSKGTVIIEIGGRLAGDRIPRLVKLATGIELAEAAALAAVGLPVSFAPTQHQVASVGFFVPARGQTQRSALTRRPDIAGLKDFEFWGRAGQHVGVPPQEFLVRLGYAVGAAGTYAESRAIIERARKAVERQAGLELLPFAGTPEPEAH